MRTGSMHHLKTAFGKHHQPLAFRSSAVLISTLLLLLFSGMRSDTVCLTNVKAVFNRMNEAVQKKQICYLKYVVTTRLGSASSGKDQVHTGTFEMITSNKQTRLYSKEMIVLKDEKTIFSILPSRKVIYWSDAAPLKKGEQAYDQLSVLQDSIFKNAEKVECTEVTGKAYTKVISVTLNKRMSTYLGISNASYFINDATQMLHQVTVNYLPGNAYESLVYDFQELNLDYKKTDMSKPVQELIFEKGKVRPEYAGYTINDNRKK